MGDTSFCLNCSKKPKCKKICKGLEKTLPKDQTGRLKGEFMLANDWMDIDFYKDGEYIIDRHKPIHGKRKHPKIYGDNWD